jgi:hypothetical protein
MEKLDHNDFTTQAPPVDSHPLSAKVNGVGWYGWQWFDHGAVYWGRGTGNVYLFVLSDERRMRVKATTPGPPTSRGQWSVGAWSSGRQTYVLLVEGGEANYRGVVRPKPTI